MTAIRTSIKTLALTFAVGLFATASPAVAATDVLGIDSASLVARGAAVDVTYSFVCDADTQVYTFVTLTQRSGRGVATGGGGPSEGLVECTGETQTVTVRVIAGGGMGGGLAFKRGVAVALVGVSSRCFPEGPEGPGGECPFSQFSEVIRITR